MSSRKKMINVTHMNNDENPKKPEESQKNQDASNVLSYTTNGGSDSPLPTTPRKPLNTLEALLLEMKEDNANNAKILKDELSGLSVKMDTQERTLSDKIALSTNNLKKAIEENALELREEINKISKRFEENEKKTEALIDLAIREYNATRKNCSNQIENKILKNPPEETAREVETHDQPTPSLWPYPSFKNPLMCGARLTGITMKIFHATGIAPHKQSILRVSISYKRSTALAWVTFKSPRIVSDTHD